MTDEFGVASGRLGDANAAGLDTVVVDKPKKKVNPLVDLIDTEKAYVDLLAAIIRRVAAAWSRTNFPPPELDAVFRSVEVVYRANRALLAKLNDIGPNPSSPKALGDLLMRWIDDLEAPYTRYCDGYTTSFDTWAPVQSNPNLQPILEDISATIPPSNYALSLDPIWTLDTLFLMPATRIKYYKKLYARLLKSTQPGRSDHKLLLGANDRLATLLATVESRSDIRVGDGSGHSAPGFGASPSAAFTPPPRKSSAVPGISASNSPSASRPMSPQDPRGMMSSLRSLDPSPTPPPAPERDSRTESNSSGRDSRHTEGRDSRGSVPTSNTSVGAGQRGSTDTMATPIIDLERRLSTTRVIDIFTMTPRKCRLQMAPPNLPFTRRLRFSADVVITFTPRSTGIEVTHQQAHIFLLTDLFLICEKMSEEERRGPEGRDGADMWLCYPPLSAKHLVVSDVDENVLEIRIMKKEVVFVHTDSRATKEGLLQDFRESLDEVLAMAPASSRPPPGPNDLSRGGSPFQPPSRSGSVAFPERSNTQSPPSNLVSSPDGMEPPRPQFGRLAAGSEPHLPMIPPGPTTTASDPSIYTPPPRGTSRNVGPGGPPLRQSNSLTRTNSADNLPPRSETLSLGVNVNGNGSMNLQPGGSLSRQPSGASDVSSLPPLPPSPLPPFPGGPQGQHGGPPPQRGPSFIDQHGGPSGSASLMMNGQFPPGPGSGPPSMRSFDTMSSSRQTSLASSYGPPRNQGGPPFPPGGGPPGGYGPGPGGPNPHMQRQPSLDSPPSSPEAERRALPTGPVTSTITAQMKCKVFLKQHHAQWKALGTAKLLLYQQEPGNVKQLVVEQENKAKTLLISTIVLMDAVERVGKTGVAIELSDEGRRTGIVYMIQLKSETSASGFFGTLLAGSDRTGS